MEQKSSKPPIDRVRFRSRIRSNGCRDFTYEDFLKLQAHQDGKCAICGKEPQGYYYHRATNRQLCGLVLDHCHKTLKIRGLLCYSCNTNMGHLEKEFDPAWKEKAIEYKNTAQERISNLRKRK